MPDRRRPRGENTPGRKRGRPGRRPKSSASPAPSAPSARGGTQRRPAGSRNRREPPAASGSAPRQDGALAAKGGERIAKLLARAGIGSRRDIERLIAAGRVAIDGKPLVTPALVLRSLDGVTVDGQPVASIAASRLFLFHKPVGVLTTAHDPAGRPTIYDILPPGLPRLMPVGRLDLNTEGLLLLTNDGELKRALELPASAVPRTYRVRAYGEVREQALEALALGSSIDGVRYGPVDASLDRRARADAANQWLTVTLHEGRNREVRRLLEGIGLRVSRLIRVAYGPFLLDDLPVRGVTEVAATALESLQRSLRRPRPKPQAQ